MKDIIKSLFKKLGSGIVIAVGFAIGIIAIMYAITWPSSTPERETAGGKFYDWFVNKIFQPCPDGKVLKGYDPSTKTHICSDGSDIPAVSSLNGKVSALESKVSTLESRGGGLGSIGGGRLYACGNIGVGSYTLEWKADWEKWDGYRWDGKCYIQQQTICTSKKRKRWWKKKKCREWKTVDMPGGRQCCAL